MPRPRFGTPVAHPLFDASANLQLNDVEWVDASGLQPKRINKMDKGNVGMSASLVVGVHCNLVAQLLWGNK